MRIGMKIPLPKKFQLKRPIKIMDQDGMGTAVPISMAYAMEAMLEEEETVDKFLGKTTSPEHKFRHVIGICPECGKRERVKRSGVMGAHKIAYLSNAHCIGSGQKPSKIVAQYDY